MSDKLFCVYMLASGLGGTIYIGVTSRLLARVWEHRTGVVEGFTRQYKVHRLVWYEAHENVESAIAREKRLKEWRRAWKIELIERENPNWFDLYPRLAGGF